MVSASSKRQVVGYLVEAHQMSERHACDLVGAARSTVRYKVKPPADEAALMTTIRDLSEAHPAYGYRFITALLRSSGWQVNVKRVERLWRSEGLQLPRRKPRKRRAGDSTGAVYRASHPNHVWSYDFISATTERGGRLRILGVIDEYTRECLALEVERSMPAQRVLQTLEWLFLVRGAPGHLRSDNGPEFIADAVQQYLDDADCDTLYITPGCPWENPFIESFFDKFRDECLNRSLFADGQEAREVVENWRIEYNTFRPHSSLGYLSPAAFAAQAAAQQPEGSPTLSL